MFTARLQQRMYVGDSTHSGPINSGEMRRVHRYNSRYSLLASRSPLPSSPRFFIAHTLPRGEAWPITFELDENAGMHIRVLRLHEGDQITCFDGEGGEFTATIHMIGRRNVVVVLTAFKDVERESPLAITLVQTLATGDKMDWIIQKATELGVSEIQPISSERATLKLSADRAEKRHAHWRATAIAACEQCGRNRVPAIHAAQSLEHWLAGANTMPCVLLHPGAAQSLTDALGDSKTASIVIGPEGGFSEDEVARAVRAGVITARFGPRILRTETAGLAALAALQCTRGDLG